MAKSGKVSLKEYSSIKIPRNLFRLLGNKSLTFWGHYSPISLALGAKVAENIKRPSISCAATFSVNTLRSKQDIEGL